MTPDHVRELSTLMKGYAICTTPRSGSNWLGQLLSSTGLLGHPLEYFNGPGRRLLDDPDYPDNAELQVMRVLSTGATPNGVYALKVFPDQLDSVSRQIRWSRSLPNLHFVYWYRRDLLGQALSRSRAAQTQQWRAHLVPQQEAAYDEAQVTEFLRLTALERARWDVFFARNDLRPLRLCYEDSLRQPQDICGAVANALGITEPAIADLSKIDLQIQRDHLTAEWRTRFVAVNADLDRIDAV